MSQLSPRNLFILSFVAIISVYFYVFGQEKTIELIKEEYLFILALVPVTIAYFYFKIQYKITKFNMALSFLASFPFPCLDLVKLTFLVHTFVIPSFVG